MTHYDARFYTNKGVEIFNKKIECTPPSIPGMLACIVMGLPQGRPISWHHKGPCHRWQVQYGIHVIIG